MKHNCCNEAGQFLNYRSGDHSWYMNIDNSAGVYISTVEFCPWCGEKLSTARSSRIELTRLEIAEISTALRFFSEEMIRLNGLAFWERTGCVTKWNNVQQKLQEAVKAGNYVLDDETISEDTLNASLTREG